MNCIFMKWGNGSLSNWTSRLFIRKLHVQMEVEIVINSLFSWSLASDLDSNSLESFFGKNDLRVPILLSLFCFTCKSNLTHKLAKCLGKVGKSRKIAFLLIESLFLGFPQLIFQSFPCGKPRNKLKTEPKILKLR